MKLVNRKKLIYRWALWLCLLTLGLAACIPAGQAVPPQASPTQIPLPSLTPTSPKEIFMVTKTPPDGETKSRPDEPTGGETGSLSTGLPAAVQSALDRLSKKLDISTEAVKVVDYQKRQWRNSCLGFSRVNEMCADVITPGWLILLEADGVQYEFHTNQDGTQVRFR